jgi:hypothetical protein
MRKAITIKAIAIIASLILLIAGIYAQNIYVDKIFQASDGEVIGILFFGKDTLSITGTIKTVIWTGTNGKVIRLGYDGIELKSDSLVMLRLIDE